MPECDVHQLLHGQFISACENAWANFRGSSYANESGWKASVEYFYFACSKSCELTFLYL